MHNSIEDECPAELDLIPTALGNVSWGGRRGVGMREALGRRYRSHPYESLTSYPQGLTVDTEEIYNPVTNISNAPNRENLPLILRI
jgi:hypothetical protein